MGHRTDWLALSVMSRVSGYSRRSKSGKTVQVDAYTRSIDKMSFDELQKEFTRLKDSTKPADVNRRNAVVSRLRTSFNHAPGEKFDSDKAQKQHRANIAAMQARAEDRKNSPEAKAHQAHIQSLTEAYEKRKEQWRREAEQRKKANA